MISIKADNRTVKKRVFEKIRFDMKNILVPIKFNGDEHIMKEKALQFGSAFKAKIWLLHVGAPDPDFVGYAVGPQYIRDGKAEDLREEHRSLQNCTELIKSEGVDAEGLLVQGATIETILQEANKLEIDLMILGSHEHGILHKIFQEGVSSQIVKQAHIPVLLVPF